MDRPDARRGSFTYTGSCVPLFCNLRHSPKWLGPAVSCASSPWMTGCDAIPPCGNAMAINKLFDSGKVEIIIITSRKKSFEQLTKDQLRKNCINYHRLIMDL